FWPAFVVNSVTFLIGAGAISRIQGEFVATRPAVSGDEGSRFWSDVLAGLAVIRCSPILLAVVMTASVANLGLGAATIMLTPFIVDVLGVQPAWFGLVEGAQSSSAILISLAIGVYG